MSTDLDYAWDAYYAEHEPEPECECRFAGDQADASDCELHNSNSQWNVSQRRIAAAIERFGETRRLTNGMNTWMDAYYERKPMGRADSIVWASAAQKICINCKRQEARWASLYCSDRCRDAFLYFGEAV